MVLRSSNCCKWYCALPVTLSRCIGVVESINARKLGIFDFFWQSSEVDDETETAIFRMTFDSNSCSGFLSRSHVRIFVANCNPDDFRRAQMGTQAGDRGLPKTFWRKYLLKQLKITTRKSIARKTWIGIWYDNEGDGTVSCIEVPDSLGACQYRLGHAEKGTGPLTLPVTKEIV